MFARPTCNNEQVMVVLAWGSEWLKMNSDVFKRFMFKLLGAISRDGMKYLY
jgi:hypothetical protein